jgi:ubiquinone/menaquinone biosynthesis C-methylase UbiE
VIGTDLSPIQPSWVPPNLQFEIDDATQQWTWDAGTFDFVHMRLLLGAIQDWDKLMKEAFRVLKPGGWVESSESGNNPKSDDGSDRPFDNVIQTWNNLFLEGGEKLGCSFQVLNGDLQRKAMENAGFVNIKVVNYKVRALSE